MTNKATLQDEIETLREEAEQLYLEAAIQEEVITILDGSGLGRSALLHDSAAALDMTLQQVWDLAHQRVLDRASWHPKNDAP